MHHRCITAASLLLLLLLHHMPQADGMMTQHPGTWAFMQGCVAAIRQQLEHGGRVCLFLGGAALASGTRLVHCHAILIPQI